MVVERLDGLPPSQFHHNVGRDTGDDGIRCAGFAEGAYRCVVDASSDKVSVNKFPILSAPRRSNWAKKRLR